VSLAVVMDHLSKVSLGLADNPVAGVCSSYPLVSAIEVCVWLKSHYQ
jgi:hypothetical protein